ncbi:MAG: pyridoxal phosphate-dependent aminotransferase [Bacteroidetes bacterium]|nr:pyridoxal phosphate-dependent aminotransferase [Bacteroidota bacterium]
MDNLNELSESETLAMTRISRELTAQGHKVINLSIGQPDFNTPQYIKDAAVEALQQNYTFYPPVPGYEDLRKAICQKLIRDNNLEFTPDQIVVSTGAKQSLANIFLALVNPGDEVILPAPYWVSYKELVKLAGGKLVALPTTVDTDFKVSPGQVEAAITPKSKLFVFSSPCNPSGTVYSKEELHALARVFARHKQVFVVSDEIYELINFIGKHETIAQFKEISDRVILVNGVSKGFAMTGWRVGYMAAARFIAKACDKIQGQITSGTCSIAQRATLRAVLQNPDSDQDIKTMVTAFHERRDYLLELLKEVPGMKTNKPDGAFYVFADCTAYFGKKNGDTLIKDGNDLSFYLLYTAYVALVAGNAFGDPNCIRFSYAISKPQLKEAVDRIKVALDKLK